MSAIAARGGARGLQWVYVFAWVFCAGLALTYLVLVMTRPELVGRISAPQRGATPEAGEPRTIARLTEEVHLLRKSVSDMQLSVAHLRTSTAALQEQDTTALARLAALEQRTNGGVIAASAAHAALPASVTQPTRTERIAVAPAAAAKAPPPARNDAASPPAQQTAVITRPNILNAAAVPPAASAIATGSIGPAAVSFGAPTVTAATDAPVGLKLGSGPSLDALRLSWSLLSERHAAVLKDYAPRVTPQGADGASYELLAGPIASAAEAKRVCDQLRARRVSCSVGAYQGEGL